MREGHTEKLVVGWLNRTMLEHRKTIFLSEAQLNGGVVQQWEREWNAIISAISAVRGIMGAGGYG